METIKLDGWKLFSSRPGSDNYYNEDETVLLKVFKGKGEQVLSGLEREKAISDAGKLLHSKKCDAPGVVYAIDLSDFTKGHYMVDPSQFYMMTHTVQTLTCENFHLKT